MDYEHLIVEREDGIAVVTINRHERRNTLAAQTIDELDRAFDELAVDDANYTPFVYRAEPGPEPETSYPSPALVADWCSGVPDRLKTNEPFTPYFTI